jgi:transcription initiation factor TFIID subunit 9B
MASEKHEKTKLANQTKHIPKDAQVICSILKEIGICDYEPRVVNQLLEFTYRKFILKCFLIPISMI